MCAVRGVCTSSLHCHPVTSRRAVAVAAASQNDGSAPGSRLAVITGANTGIGLETARALLKQGYRVTLACRDATKAAAAQRKLLQEVPNAAGVDTLSLDLADLASVRHAAAHLLDAGEPLDLLVNNAGVMATPQMQTKDGFELQLGVNHVGHFLWTQLLMPLLSSPDTPTRIVNVSSHAHYFGHMHFDDLMLTKAGAYSPWKSYGQSKLANVLFSYELARRLPASANATVLALHPGLVDTELSRYMVPENPNFFQRALMAAAKPLALTPEQGARTSIYCATAPELGGVSGKYFDACRPVTSSKESYDASVAAKLWDVSSELVGL